MLHSLAGEHGTLGEEFVFNFPTCYDTDYSPTLMISTPSINSVSVNVSVSGIKFDTKSTVTREQHAEIELPTSTYMSLVDSAQNKTIIVRADEEVSVYGISCKLRHSDGFTMLPSYALGKKYMILTHKPYRQKSKASLISISSLGEETDVQIALPDQRQINIKLNAYQSYQVHDGSSDLSKSVVEANNAIAVMAGVEISDGPDGTGDNGMLEMLPSISNFGQNFVLVPFKGRTQGYVYRIITPTKVSISITNIGSVDVDAGKMYEGDVLDDSITLISSEKPVLVMQYMKGYADGKGDSAMVIVPPTEMFGGDITFPVFASGYTHYISIIAQCSARQGLIYNNAMLNDGFDTLSQDCWCAFRSEVTFGTHDVKHTDPDVTFCVVVYGFKPHDGYTYTAGFNAISCEFHVAYIKAIFYHFMFCKNKFKL